MGSKQFDTLTASEIYCGRCRRAQPVREKLLLVLPGAEIYEYKCLVCGESVGSREVSQRKPSAITPASVGTLRAISARAGEQA